MTTIDRSAPVMVTGATGYVAGQLVKKLLEEGLTVNAPVRNPQNAESLKYLNALADSTPGTIHYFKADLMEAGSYDAAMNGCELIFHTASPFSLGGSDPLKELIEPAQVGTRNVLESANKTASVKRIVLTSSAAAMYTDNSEIAEEKNGALSEDDWNTTASISHSPYNLSKTLAEKEAWKIYEQQNQWNLVTINPTFVIGPGINPNGTSESFNVIKKMGDGSMKPGAPRWGIGTVDVRDLALAHYNAGFFPAAKGRHLISGHDTDFLEMARTLRPRFGKTHAIPNRAIPKVLTWAFGPMLEKALTRKLVANNVGVAFKADNSKSIAELGMRYRPLEESMNDFFQQLVDANNI